MDLQLEVAAPGVTQLVETICKSIGIGIENMAQLVPELAKCKIAENIGSIVICVFLMILSLVAFLITSKWCKADMKTKIAYNNLSDYCSWMCFTGATILIWAIGLILLSMSIYDLIGWSISPNTKAIEYVISMLK